MSHYNPKPGEPFIDIMEDRTYKTWCDFRRKAKRNPICERWQKYQNFYDDMGAKPNGTILVRLDDKGEFNSENCRWMTRKEKGQHDKSS